jgi:hypothetical protein
VKINCLRKIKEEKEIKHTNKEHNNLRCLAIYLHPCRGGARKKKEDGLIAKKIGRDTVHLKKKKKIRDTEPNAT